MLLCTIEHSVFGTGKIIVGIVQEAAFIILVKGTFS